MDDTEDDARYPPNPYPVNFHQTFPSSHRPKLPVRNAPINNGFTEEDEEEDEEEEEEEQEEEQEAVEEIAEEVEEEDGEDEERGDGYGGEEDDHQNQRLESASSESRGKRRSEKLAFEFAPRAASAAKPSPSFGRNLQADWSEQATFILLDAWGDRFLQLGRKSLRSEEWMEVAKKVSVAWKTARTDTQCRNRLDTLKKKYKREKMRMAETGSSVSKWVYFKKMETLLTASPRQPGLACGLDSREYVLMNPRVYLNQSNGLDEMRDGPGASESSDEDSDVPPMKKTRFSEVEEDGEGSFRLLADSIQKFGEIYEKIENSKRKQMLELEKMRMEFHRDLELQTRQILQRTQAEIAKIRQGNEEIDVSVTNTSG